jgi:hypothetical protein
MKGPVTLCVLPVAILSMALVMLVGCDEAAREFIQNEPPGVRLTATPPDSGTTGYDIEFRWEGWDSDGEVDYFLYAIDPRDMYGTEDSVWTRTDAYSGRFVFGASDFDTLYSWNRPQIAKSWHVFVIKAVDDMGAISEPDYVAFNAATIAPRTQFTAPPPNGGIQQYMGGPQGVGLRVTFRWDGDDVDGIVAGEPVGYYFKVVDVTGESSWAKLATRVWEDTTEWIGGGPDYKRVVLELDDRRAYAAAVRAIDEAGAIEPLLLLNGNLLWIAARERDSFPRLSVRSLALGQRTWSGWTRDTETYEVPVGSIYELSLSGDASWYGGLISGFSFGWDLEDLDSTETDPNGNGAWTPWSTSRTTIHAKFTEGRDYFLYVKCRDDGGGLTLATIRFQAIQLEPTKKLCYIDDWRKYDKAPRYGEPLDDQVWQTMLEGYNYGDDWEDVSWDEWGAPYREEMPTLEFLSQFQVVVWSLMDNRELNNIQKSAWYNMNYLSTSNVLAIYMTSRSGLGERGKVWAFGRGLVESSVLPYTGYVCEYPYAVDQAMTFDPVCGIRAGLFAFDYLHITGQFDEADRTSGGTRIDLFDNYYERANYVFVDTAGPAIPKDKYTRPPAAELYPELPFRIRRNSNGGTRGWPFCFFEVLEYPKPDQERQDIFYDPVSEQMTGLIPLYRFNSMSPDSHLNNLYCGFRYIPSELSDPSEIVYFFFPMFPFDDSDIRATAKVVLSDWFGLPDPDVTGDFN